MLSRLHIKNYALIDTLNISFDKDLNILTGETGAGKSIILGALGLILGQRAESKYFFNQQKKCVIEGYFHIKDYALKLFFEDNDLDYEDETVLRREISLDGKSRAFINDTPVTLNILKQLGEQLIDIHSQHATLEINSTNFQLFVVDLMADHEESLLSYRNSFKLFKKKQKELNNLNDNIAQAKADLDYFEFQYNELEQANLSADEQEELEKELNLLTHAEEIKQSLVAVSSLIQNQEQAALEQLKAALSQLQSVEKYQPELTDLISRLKSSIIEIKDITEEISILEEAAHYQPGRTTELNDRLSLIYNLQKKHRVSTNFELLNIQKELSEKLNKILFADEDIALLEKEIEAEKVSLMSRAKIISDKRLEVIPHIETHIHNLLSEVGMNNALIKIDQSLRKDEEFDVNGIDDIKFLFTANKGHQLNDLSKVASGGELSRLMLSIKSLIAQKTALPTIIFDEIDTGVSGEVANRVGNIMEKLAANMQVIAITHLPQMASKGKAHYFVYKEVKDDFTYSQIRKLSKEERIVEIAKMLSGENPKEAALQNARELLIG